MSPWEHIEEETISEGTRDVRGGVEAGEMRL